MESEPILNPQFQNSKGEPKGCSGLAAVILLSLWTFFLTFIAQTASWTIVQAIFEGSFSIPNVRWIITLAYGILLLVPFVIAALVVKEPIFKNRIIALRNIAILALLISPSKLPSITDWQCTAVLQLAALIIFLPVVFFLNRQSLRNTESQPVFGLFLLAASAGAVLGLPWVLWGAQGSSVDTLLALLISTALGAVIALVLITDLQTPEDALNEPAKPHGIGGAGWIITLGLVILTTAIDQNGNGWILLLSVLPLGFACAALAYQQNGKVTLPGRAAAGVLSMLGFAWPMMMIDPDELSLIVTMGKGELLEYTSNGTMLASALAFLIMVVFLVLYRILKKHKFPLLIGMVIFALAWGGILGLYWKFGQPGNYGEKAFVVLKSQADLSSLQAIADPQERRMAVYATLVKHAEDSQKDIRAWLDGQGVKYRAYYLVNAIEVETDPILRLRLASRSDVDRVLDSPILRPLSEEVPEARGQFVEPPEDLWNIRMIGADKVHADLHVFGDGITIGQSDSGVQGDHPELSAGYRGNREGSDDFNWLDPWYGSSQPTDIGGHGTHTLGSILGKNVGVAPEAEWIGCVNLGRNLGNPAYYMDCMQFMLAPYPQNGDSFTDGKAEKGANILNNSWGCPEVEGCDAETFLPAVGALKTAGIFVVASAGNSGMGGCSTVQDPLSIYADVYSVGAVNETRNLAGFSSIGPVNVDGSGRIKPDIVAPGVAVYSSYPGSTYEIADGTSMAGPHVAGVVALMWSANPKLIGEIEKTREILNETADEYKGAAPECVDTDQRPNNAAGFGIVNAYKAVQKALDYR